MKPPNPWLRTAVLTWLLVSAIVWAHSPNDSPDMNMRTLEPLVGRASLIVFGEVVDIQYRSSEPTKEQPQGLPHTFVSYKVREVLRGDLPGEILTLRIPGGADGRGGFYMETDAPTFARGQTDVLFVSGGEVEGCQLVGCVEGRYRVYEDRVFNAWGVPVAEAKERLVIGGRPRFDLNVTEVPRPSFDDLLLRPEVRELLAREVKSSGLSVEELRARYEKEAPETSTVDYGLEPEPQRADELKEPEAEPIEKHGEPMKIDEFFEAVRAWSERVGEPREKVVMADPRKRFIVPDPRLDPLNVEIERDKRGDAEEQEDEEAKEGSQ